MIESRYSGQGFVEALIAIIIAGVATIGFLQIASRTISEVIENELRDQIAQEAVRNGRLVDYIISEYNEDNPLSYVNQFIASANSSPGACYSIDGTPGSLSLIHI